MADVANGLTQYQKVMVRIPEMVDKTTGTVFPAEEFETVVLHPNVRCAISRIPGVEVKDPKTGGIVHVAVEWVSPIVKVPRTPLTWDNLYAWAERFVGKEHASAESVLVDLLLAHDYRSIGDYGINELRETLLDFHKSGCVGYVQMERDDLKKECEERFLDPDNCGMDLTDLEDLIEELGFQMEPDEEEGDGEEDEEGDEEPLTEAEKDAALEDFREWSGGFDPWECGEPGFERTDERVNEFIEACRSAGKRV